MVTGLADYRSLAVPDPLYYALSAAHASLGPVQALIAVVAILGLISVVLASVVGQARIFYSMARDGLLPPAFARLSGRNETPVVGTVVTGVVAAAIARAGTALDPRASWSRSARCSRSRWYASGSWSCVARRHRRGDHSAPRGCHSCRCSGFCAAPSSWRFCPGPPGDGFSCGCWRVCWSTPATGDGTRSWRLTRALPYRKARHILGAEEPEALAGRIERGLLGGETHAHTAGGGGTERGAVHDRDAPRHVERAHELRARESRCPLRRAA